MGSDDLFKKKKAAKELVKRKKGNINRSAPKREPYETVLIVTEGETTEVHYINLLVDLFRINSANVVVVPKGGASPASIVEDAYEEYKHPASNDDSYDVVFSVFDRDDHKSYDQAIKRAKIINKEIKDKLVEDGVELKRGKSYFQAIFSNPCIEYWFLLHYNYTNKPYGGKQTRSVCQEVTKDLERYLGHKYQKNNVGALPILADRNAIEQAIRNGRFSLRDKKSDGALTYTNFGFLVSYLRDLKK